MVVIMNNPPAFPTSHEEPDDYNGHNNSKKTVIDQGMTLRDYMAAHAISTVPPQTSYNMKPKESHEDYVSRRAYEMADAMLAAREQK